MLVLFLFIGGFFMAATSLLGDQISNGFQWALYVYWFLAIFVALIAILLPIMGALKGAEIGGKLGGFIGATGGLLYSGFIIAIYSVQIYLITYVIDNLDPAVSSFGAIEKNVQYAIFAIVALFVFGRMSSSKS